MAQLYPLGDILGVIDDRTDADRAMKALHNAAVPEGNVDLVDGTWFNNTMREIKEQRNPIERLQALIAAEEGEATRQLVQEAAGHTIIVVHAEDIQACQNVVRVLAEHGTHSLRHYGQLVIT